MTDRFWRFTLAALIVLLLGLAMAAGLAWTWSPRPVRAAGSAVVSPEAAIVVNNNADELVNGDGLCSLREAVRSANLDLAVDSACGAGSGDDTIILHAGVYTLTIGGDGEDAALTGDLDVTSTLTIVGFGMDVTVINGSVALGDRMFDVRNGAAITMTALTLRDATSGGYGGAAVNVQSVSALTLISCAVRDNRTTAANGGSIYVNSNSAVILDSCIITGNVASANGGAIYSYGVLTITSSAIVNNSAAGSPTAHVGGGIALASGSRATLTNSTVSGNRATGYGGGINAGNSSTLNLINVTVAGNTADSDSNEDGQGGGIALDGATTRMTNTLIANNVDPSPSSRIPDCWRFAGTIGGDYNLLRTAGCVLTGTHNVTGVDPLLGPLADNGGGTWTHALLAGSPAIDAGDPVFATSLDFDQRGFGFPRILNGRIDIGAYEAWLHVYLPLVLR